MALREKEKNIKEKLYTVTDLAELAALPENRDKKFELIEGVIFEVTTGTPKHGYVILEIAAFIREHNRGKDLGFVFTDTVTYELSPKDEFVPDVSFISKERAPNLPPKRYFIAPDLAIKLHPPTLSFEYNFHAARRYLQFGTQVVWLILPEAALAQVVRGNPDGSLGVQLVERNGNLSADEVLPSFSLPLADILPSEG